MQFIIKLEYFTSFPCSRLITEQALLYSSNLAWVAAEKSFFFHSSWKRSAAQPQAFPGRPLRVGVHRRQAGASRHLRGPSDAEVPGGLRARRSTRARRLQLRLGDAGRTSRSYSRAGEGSWKLAGKMHQVPAEGSALQHLKEAPRNAFKSGRLSSADTRFWPLPPLHRPAVKELHEATVSWKSSNALPSSLWCWKRLPGCSPPSDLLSRPASQVLWHEQPFVSRSSIPETWWPPQGATLVHTFVLPHQEEASARRGWRYWKIPGESGHV